MITDLRTLLDKFKRMSFSLKGMVSLRNELTAQEKFIANFVLQIAFVIVLFCFVGFFELFWPNVIPFRFFDMWRTKGSLGHAIVMSWPLLVIGLGFNIVKLIKTRNKPEINRKPEMILEFGCLVSTFAGVFEEITFRWLLFYSEMIMFQFLNLLFFQWIFHWGLFSWIYSWLTPMVNTITFGFLQPQLMNDIGWYVGAAIISSNWKFRDGHLYQGFWGSWHAWFGGMFFFYLAFNYGLLSAMIVHFLYDFYIFGLVYIDSCIEKAQGNV